MKKHIQIGLLALTTSTLLGCASTTKSIDSLPLAVVGNIDAIDNSTPVSFTFTPCSEKVCNNAGFKSGGFKYAIDYSPNNAVKNLFSEYIESKFLNMDNNSNNVINVQLLSVDEVDEAINNSSDFFKSADDMSVTYKLTYKLKITYKNSKGQTKTFPTTVKKTITSTQKNMAIDLKSGVSNAIGLAVIKLDKYISKNI